MPIEDKIIAIKKDFSSENWEVKYEKIIEYGKNWPGLNENSKIEDLKIKGCQSQVWIKAELNAEKKIIFTGDSDAIIVKGLVAIVLKVYSGESPETILATTPDFLKEIGFYSGLSSSSSSGLSSSRTNGLYAMIKQIKYYATAFQYLLSK